MHSSKKEGCNQISVVLQYLSVTDTCLWRKDMHIQMCFVQRQWLFSKNVSGVYMGETKYFVVNKKAVPEVLLKVVEAKRLLETGKVLTIQEAVDSVGISRSSFYKYQDDIFQFHDNAEGTTITLTFQMDDEPGLLSDVLKIVADFGANILTIHQSIPINGIASLSISVQVLSTTKNVSQMIEAMEDQKGVHYVKIIAKE